jgi:hypothetical protein
MDPETDAAKAASFDMYEGTYGDEWDESEEYLD